MSDHINQAAALPISDAEIAVIMGWCGPGAYTEASLRKIRRIVEQAVAADRAQQKAAFDAAVSLAGDTINDRNAEIADLRVQLAQAEADLKTTRATIRLMDEGKQYRDAHIAELEAQLAQQGQGEPVGEVVEGPAVGMGIPTRDVCFIGSRAKVGDKLYLAAPASAQPAELERLREIARLIGSIFVHGDFKAETHNERELEKLLRAQGTFYESLADYDANAAAAPQQPAARVAVPVLPTNDAVYAEVERMFDHHSSTFIGNAVECVMAAVRSLATLAEPAAPAEEARKYNFSLQGLHDIIEPYAHSIIARGFTTEEKDARLFAIVDHIEALFDAELAARSLAAPAAQQAAPNPEGV